jgi:hypothetical protein
MRELLIGWLIPGGAIAADDSHGHASKAAEKAKDAWARRTL